ncbi:hypothetical protein HK405_007316 [Cladochytrium tenue]|nr:hypothetical protein HK405_007316 [Cladochytrium tenue]
MDEPRVLVFGSLNVDEIFQVPHVALEGETLSSVDYARVAGGKGANQSVAVAEALAGSQGHVAHAGRVGADGAWLKAELAGHGVDVAFIRDDAERVSQATRDNAIVLLPGANYGVTADQVHETLSAFSPGDGDGAGGSIVLLQNEISLVPDIIRQAHAAGMLVAFNPAPCPPSLASEYPVGLVSVLIVNRLEADSLASGLTAAAADNDDDDADADADGATPRTAMECVQLLLAALPALEVVVVTLGASGAVAGLRGGGSGSSVSCIHAPALAGVKPVDTTAAGDTFVGYFLAELALAQRGPARGGWREADVRRALRVAVAASGIACERHGAIPSIPTRKEVMARIA